MLSFTFFIIFGLFYNTLVNSSTNGQKVYGATSTPCNENIQIGLDNQPLKQWCSVSSSLKCCQNGYDNGVGAWGRCISCPTKKPTIFQDCNINPLLCSSQLKQECIRYNNAYVCNGIGCNCSPNCCKPDPVKAQNGIIEYYCETGPQCATFPTKSPVPVPTMSPLKVTTTKGTTQKPNDECNGLLFGFGYGFSIGKCYSSFAGSIGGAISYKFMCENNSKNSRIYNITYKGTVDCTGLDITINEPTNVYGTIDCSGIRDCDTARIETYRFCDTTNQNFIAAQQGIVIGKCSIDIRTQKYIKYTCDSTGIQSQLFSDDKCKSSFSNKITTIPAGNGCSNGGNGTALYCNGQWYNRFNYFQNYVNKETTAPPMSTRPRTNVTGNSNNVTSYFVHFSFFICFVYMLVM